MLVILFRILLAILLGVVSASTNIAQSAVHECDRTAAHPEDNERAVLGVQWRDLDSSAALAACRKAIAAYPGTWRFHYQLGRGFLKIGDNEAAFETFRLPAAHGYAMAQFALGTMYEGGRATPRDLKSAVAWYRRAAEQGNTPGQNNLARMYLEGRGLKKNPSQAVEWFTKAAENGSAVARTNLGNMLYAGHGVRRDYAKAASWYRKAAELDDAKAMINLALLHELGKGVARNQATAFELYRRAALLGSVAAQTNVALMYREGRGTAKDDALAAHWFKRAASRGHAIAQNILGLMYAKGQGVDQNDSTAVEWYRTAARQGYAIAQTNLGLMYAEGRGVAKDEKQAAEWIRRAAEQGNADAQYNLGVLYSRGRGVPRDLAESARWHIRAARQDIAAGRGLRLSTSSPTERAAYSILSITPLLLFGWVLARQGRNRALTGTLWRTAGLGGLVAVGSALIGIAVPNVINEPNEFGLQSITLAFLAAAAPEELGRFCVLYFYCFKRGAFSRPMNGLKCGVVASLGFAAVENAVYAFSGGIEVVIMKLATTTPLHIAFGVIMAGILALAGRDSPQRRRKMINVGLCLPVLLHGLYDIVVLTAMGAEDWARNSLDILLIAYIAVILGLSLLVYRRVQKRQALHKAI